MSLAAKLVLSPLLVVQALLTRARLPRLPEADGEREGVLGDGPRLRLLITGDSSANETGTGLGIRGKLQQIGFRIEAGVRCRQGFVLSAIRQGFAQIENAA